MKRILLAASLLLFSSLHCFAQSIGFKFGYSADWLKQNISIIDDKIVTQTNTLVDGPRMSVFARLDTNRWMFNFDVGISMGGYNYKVSNPDEGWEFEPSTRLRNFELSVSAGHTLIDDLRIFTGISLWVPRLMFGKSLTLNDENVAGPAEYLAAIRMQNEGKRFGYAIDHSHLSYLNTHLGVRYDIKRFGFLEALYQINLTPAGLFLYYKDVKYDFRQAGRHLNISVGFQFP